VITIAMFGKIRRMHFRDGLSISEIARRTSLPRNIARAQFFYAEFTRKFTQAIKKRLAKPPNRLFYLVATGGLEPPTPAL
jgi:hypothetical protein